MGLREVADALKASLGIVPKVETVNLEDRLADATRRDATPVEQRIAEAIEALKSVPAKPATPPPERKSVLKQASEEGTLGKGYMNH